MNHNPIWLPQPEDHDYVAAAEYLSLLAISAVANLTAEKLRAAPMVAFKAKDILRASNLPHLPADNAHVAKDLRKVDDREALSPILLVRGDAAEGHPLIIADGYHRVCAAVLLDENVEVPCKLADL